MIPSEVTTALKAVTSAFGGADAAAPGTPAAGTPVPGTTPADAAAPAPPSAVPWQPGPREIAAQQGQPAQPVQDTELVTDQAQAVPASITPPGSLNGNVPSSGEDG